MSNLIYRDKVQDSESDTGQDVRHVSNGDMLTEAVLKRASRNLERRTIGIQKYMSEEQDLRRSQQSRNLSLIDVNPDGTIRAPGMLRILRDSGAYFLVPGHIRADEDTRDYRILVVSGVDGKGTYCLKREALYSFYTDDAGANYNPDKGLSVAGDTICLRVPRRSAAEVSSSDKDLVASTSQATDFSAAIVSTSVSEFIRDESLGADATGVLVKSPAETLITLTIDNQADDLSGLEDYLDDYVAGLKLDAVTGGETHTYLLDHRNIEYSDSVLKVYTADYLAVDEQNLQGDLTLYYGDFTATFNSSQVQATTSRGSTDPYSELIPLFYHAGDRIVVTGLGSVLTSTIDQIDDLGFPVLMSGDGRTVSTYTRGQVNRITAQVSVEVPSGFATADYEHEEELFYDSTLVDSGYVIESIDIVEVSGSQPDDYLAISYVQAASDKISLLNTSGILDLSQAPGSKVSVRPLKTLDTLRANSTIQPSEKLRFTVSSSSGTPTVGMTVIARVNYVERLEHP
jgi:hypothetical protein